METDVKKFENSKETLKGKLSRNLIKKKRKWRRMKEMDKGNEERESKEVSSSTTQRQPQRL